MNKDVFQHERAEVLKKVGITAQREIENAVREALSKGGIHPAFFFSPFAKQSRACLQ